MFRYYFMFMKNPRKFICVEKKQSFPKYLRKKNQTPWTIRGKNQTPKNHLDRLWVCIKLWKLLGPPLAIAVKIECSVLVLQLKTVLLFLCSGTIFCQILSILNTYIPLFLFQIPSCQQILNYHRTNAKSILFW